MIISLTFDNCADVVGLWVLYSVVHGGIVVLSQ
jgi:hypothetical protein